MPRSRIPTVIKQARGDKVPHDDVQPSRDDIKPPEELSKAARKVWATVAAKLDRAGVLTVMDEEALAAYCETYAELRGEMMEVDVEGTVVHGAAGQPVVNPHYRNVLMLRKQLLDMMRGFGMDPASRSKVKKRPPRQGEEPPKVGGKFADVKALRIVAGGKK